jgi:hypothetical protein
VQVKRGETVRAEVNLYDFLLEGRMPLVQLADGDVIFVKPRRNSVLVTGMAQNAKRFEFADGIFTVGALSRLAKPQASATHVRVVRNTGSTRNVEYYALEQAQQVTVSNGDDLRSPPTKQGTSRCGSRASTRVRRNTCCPMARAWAS